MALVAVLAAAVAVPDSFATRYALIQRDVVQTLFEDDASAAPQPGVAKPTGQTRADPWASTPRVNMLLLGSDAGTDRTGVRTDSMMVASIDTKTGRTVLLSLPRNLQRVPFPSSNPLHRLWPNGYDCGSECLLNAVWTEADNHKDLFPGVRSPGLETVRGVIGEVLGLRIDYTTIIDLKGFSGLVDAMGGVVVDVPRRIPIGGGHNQATGAALPITGWIEPGTQRLTGYRALWFSRSREGSDDYDRMRRQRCMVGALLDQSNPATLLARYPRLAKVLQRNLSTDVPRSDLPAWVTLVQRVQGGGVSSLPFTSDVISTVHPDFTHIREPGAEGGHQGAEEGQEEEGREGRRGGGLDRRDLLTGPPPVLHTGSGWMDGMQGTRRRWPWIVAAALVVVLAAGALAVVLQRRAQTAKEQAAARLVGQVAAALRAGDVSGLPLAGTTGAAAQTARAATVKALARPTVTAGATTVSGDVATAPSSSPTRWAAGRSGAARCRCGSRTPSAGRWRPGSWWRPTSGPATCCGCGATSPTARRSPVPASRCWSPTARSSTSASSPGGSPAPSRRWPRRSRSRPTSRRHRWRSGCRRPPPTRSSTSSPCAATTTTRCARSCGRCRAWCSASARSRSRPRGSSPGRCSGRSGR
ncbi:hypothetical protein GCM10025868_20320 [Angustibacter aerolatus]|uniref:Cell envelope-related transcriptional attenuator domain-containing protein n=1 Tax=Angustibacter aerolatus TaxID=1162965 RepID=A0ABQ6JG70_9ACTN|nr:hypothetical protein GCM10025868_20320 [Angustibacter aerolatus]